MTKPVTRKDMIKLLRSDADEILAGVGWVEQMMGDSFYRDEDVVVNLDNIIARASDLQDNGHELINLISEGGRND